MSGWTRAQAVLAVAAALVWIAAAVLTPVMRRAELSSLSAEVARLRVQTRAAAELREELRILRLPDAAATARLGRMDTLDMLRLLGDLLPGDIQLSDLEIDDDSAGLSVIGGDARKAAAVLERSGRFRRVSLRAPVGRGPFRIELSR